MNSESKKLILIVISATRLIASLEDKFFKHKLFARLPSLLDSYLEFKKGANVAQYRQNYYKLKVELENLLESIDYIIYSNIHNDTPLLQLKRRILSFRLYTLQSLKKFYIPNNSKEEKGTLVSDKIEIVKPQVFNSVSKDNSISSKDRILDFVKKSKKIRTKDLIEEFSAFSERTVKRTLKDLTDHGILKREEVDNGAVYYSIVH